MSECLNVIEWIRHFLGELGIVQDKTKVYEDNQAAISLATSLSISANSRHVVVRYSRVREAVANDIIDVIYVPTHLQLADMLTKIVPIPNLFDNYRLSRAIHRRMLSGVVRVTLTIIKGLVKRRLSRVENFPPLICNVLNCFVVCILLSFRFYSKMGEL